jgi:SAM-dependent methyltransferase
MLPKISINTYSLFYNYCVFKANIFSNDLIDKILLFFEDGLPLEARVSNIDNVSLYHVEWQGVVNRDNLLDFPHIEIIFINRNLFKFSSNEIATIIKSKNSTKNLERRFFELIDSQDFVKVLEIGSRPRKGTIRRSLFSKKQYTGIDILTGENVDIVADAHNLSTVFLTNTFDAIYSIYVFEHLAMPWKVALEISKIMRNGAIAYLLTHQTYGVHDEPWDFWRYNQNTWKTIFNSATGFEVLDTAVGDALFTLPRLYNPSWKNAEKVIGYCDSAALIKKTSEPRLEWNMTINDVTTGEYPTDGVK